MMKFNKIVVAILLVIILFVNFAFKADVVQAVEIKNTSMYMWEVNGIDFSIYEKIINYLKINKVYAYIGTADLENKIGNDEELLFEYNKNKNIDTYIVYDENYADQTENLNRIKSLIDEVNNFNNNSSKYRISGIAIDSEFHCLPGYGDLSKQEQIELFTNYVNAMKSAYEYANQYGIKYVPCIPVWLDKLDKTQLEELIKNGCDYVQLMNYTKNGMVTNIKDEVEFAKKYNKPIENIAELQKPGSHGDVTDDISFYNDGIDACNQKFQEIYNEYNYELLTFSYHYYKPMTELIKDVNNNTDNEETQDNSNDASNEEENIPNSNNNKTEEKDNQNLNENKISEENSKSVNNLVNNQNVQTNNTNQNVIIANTSNTVNANNSTINAIQQSDNTVANKILPNTGVNIKKYIVLGIVSIALLIRSYKNIK